MDIAHLSRAVCARVVPALALCALASPSFAYQHDFPGTLLYSGTASSASPLNYGLPYPIAADAMVAIRIRGTMNPMNPDASLVNLLAQNAVTLPGQVLSVGFDLLTKVGDTSSLQLNVRRSILSSVSLKPGNITYTVSDDMSTRDPDIIAGGSASFDMWLYMSSLMMWVEYRRTGSSGTSWSFFQPPTAVTPLFFGTGAVAGLQPRITVSPSGSVPPLRVEIYSLSGVSAFAQDVNLRYSRVGVGFPFSTQGPAGLLSAMTMAISPLFH